VDETREGRRRETLQIRVHIAFEVLFDIGDRLSVGVWCTPLDNTDEGREGDVGTKANIVCLVMAVSRLRGGGRQG